MRIKLITKILSARRITLLLFFRAAFASWLLMNLLLVVVPRYGAYAMIITSLFLLMACFVYYALLPANPLIIRFEDNKQLTFSFGWCFWLTFFAGERILLVDGPQVRSRYANLVK